MDMRVIRVKPSIPMDCFGVNLCVQEAENQVSAFHILPFTPLGIFYHGVRCEELGKSVEASGILSPAARMMRYSRYHIIHIVPISGHQKFTQAARAATFFFPSRISNIPLAI